MNLNPEQERRVKLLMERMNITNQHEFEMNCLSLMYWAVGEIEKGYLISSYDKEKKSVVTIDIPWMKEIKKVEEK